MGMESFFIIIIIMNFNICFYFWKLLKSSQLSC